jgi:hypothetical protein
METDFGNTVTDNMSRSSAKGVELEEKSTASKNKHC